MNLYADNKKPFEFNMTTPISLIAVHCSSLTLFHFIWYELSNSIHLMNVWHFDQIHKSYRTSEHEIYIRMLLLLKAVTLWKQQGFNTFMTLQSKKINWLVCLFPPIIFNQFLCHCQWKHIVASQQLHFISCRCFYYDNSICMRSKSLWENRNENEMLKR